MSPEQAGTPGTGPWVVYAGDSPFIGLTVANPDHSVIQGTGNCVNVP